MIVFGYVKNYTYAGDGALCIQVRIPSIHGPYNLKDYKGATVRNYTPDDKLPYYSSLLLPHLPSEGEVVALAAINGDNKSVNDFIVIGLTGGSYANSLSYQVGE